MSRAAASPLFLFLAVWALAGILYVSGICAGLFPPPHALTVGVLLLNIGAFSLGYLTWALWQDLPSQRLASLRVDCAPALPKQIHRALAFTLLMGVIALLLMLYRVTQMAAHSHVGVFELLRNPSLLRSQFIECIEMSAWQISPMIMLVSLTSGLFAMGFILLGVFLRLDTTSRRYVYLGGFLLVGLATCLINLNRYDMTTYVLYLILTYGMTASVTPRQTGRRLVRDLLPAVAGVVVICVVIELLLHKSATYGESGHWRSILFSLYWYPAAPIAALDNFLTNFQGDYTLGARTLVPFFKWLHRFHLIGPHSFVISGEFLHIPYPVNVYTYLRSFYEDFGLFGVAIGPYVYGLLMAIVRGPAQRHFQYLNLYILLLVPLLFSFYHYWLLSTQFYLQILCGFVFFRYEIGPLEPRR